MEAVDSTPQDKPRKHMDIAELMQVGYLQEANRLFFHPLGLALEVNRDKNEETGEKGPWYISGVWDARDDLEGIIFGDDIMKDKETPRKAQSIENEMRARSGSRTKGLGFMIQPLGEEAPRKGKRTKKEKGDS